MPHSEHYRLLIDRCNKLGKALLPRNYSPTGNYKESTYERVRGFKLLVHAELEYYFEELVKAMMENAKTKWYNNGEATKTLVALVAYCDTQFHAIPDKVNDQHAKEDLEFRIKKAFQTQYEYIQAKNHGIKENNTIALFLPVGVDINDLDNNLLIALDNMGSERGQIAHKTRAKQCPSPSDAITSVVHILEMVGSFDTDIFNEYLS